MTSIAIDFENELNDIISKYDIVIPGFNSMYPNFREFIPVCVTDRLFKVYCNNYSSKTFEEIVFIAIGEVYKNILISDEIDIDKTLIKK